MPEVSVGQPKARSGGEYTALAALIRDSGLLRRRYGYYWTKLVLVPVLTAALVFGFVLLGDSWWQMFTAAIFAFLFTQIAFLGHDSAHRQIFRSGRWNDWVSLVVGDLFVGMSYGWCVPVGADGAVGPLAGFVEEGDVTADSGACDVLSRVPGWCGSAPRSARAPARLLRLYRVVWPVLWLQRVAWRGWVGFLVR
jgi:hypothetical protein